MQEMFNRAWHGLKGQGWAQCLSDPDNFAAKCQYTRVVGGVTTHCAWGWVDPEVPEGTEGTVRYLKRRGIGLASHLDEQATDFADELQCAHDSAIGPEDMQTRLRAVARQFELTVPEAA